MGQIPRSTERISSYSIKLFFYQNIPTSFLPGCDKIDERSVDIFISYERLFSLVFWEEWLVGAKVLSDSAQRQLVTHCMHSQYVLLDCVT